MKQIPRKEYPRPQFQREGWLNLNGEWQFEIDNGRSAEARGLYKNGVTLNGVITVPFCPQSRLSGVEHKDFLYGVVYRRDFRLTKAQTAGRTVLHFGAVDYACRVFVNEQFVGAHRGGYVSFSFDVTGAVKAGVNTVTVIVTDDERDLMIPRGKQSEEFYSHACDYTRTTGIWQTVWAEFTPAAYIESVKYYPSPETKSVTVVAKVIGSGKLTVAASYEGKEMGKVSADCVSGPVTVTVPLKEKHLWEIGKGRLYDVELTFGEDKVKSYFGLRTVGIDGYRFLLNGKSVFQRLVLDQGFYPDGIYTAPTDADLIRDIKMSMDCGFNGARLHQKIFEERFLYHADKLGYIVWGEFPDWGLDNSTLASVPSILGEWTQEVERDFNHPAIIGWCPHNETWDWNGRRQDDYAIEIVYRVTKALDPTRPCIDTSGNYHVVTDIYDVHNYEQNVDTLRSHYEKLPTENTFHDFHAHRQQYDGKLPVFVSEYGGIGWTEGNDGWGYGNGPKTKEEFIERFCGMAKVLLENPRICGVCYTQLTDVEQEKNGLYRYDRTPKFDVKIFHKALTKKAAIED